ncbi:hypothetical protein HN51_056362, partial [Arachis hypogaea]
MERDSKVDRSKTGIERDVKYKKNVTPATNEKLKAEAEHNNPFSGTGRQHRVAQETLVYKDEQLREAPAWINRVREMDAGLRERTRQYNQLWMGFQRQLSPRPFGPSPKCFESVPHGHTILSLLSAIKFQRQFLKLSTGKRKTQKRRQFLKLE